MRRSPMEEPAFVCLDNGHTFDSLYILFAFQSGVIMINLCKTISSLCMLLAIIWFAQHQEFGAVLLGILSISVFMMSFLPLDTKEDH